MGRVRVRGAGGRVHRRVDRSPAYRARDHRDSRCRAADRAALRPARGAACGARRGLGQRPQRSQQPARGNRRARRPAARQPARPRAPPRELRIAVSESGPSLTISLWDSGTPLSVEAEQRLVTPFRFTQSAGGGEIEFALARALAQSSGGTLRLRPRPGGGAEVVVTLPKSVLAPLARATAATPSLPKLRILVVDDDAVNRQAMRLLLEREGHEVVAVENGLEAIERLGPASDRFDAVVTDLQMPRLGGRALYEQLREQRPQLAERFVFVTGDRARDETRRFLDECGQPSVMKPYDFSDLIGALGKVAGKK